MEIKVDNDLNIKDIVYLIHDFEQRPRMITGIRINPYDILYELQSGLDQSYHYDFEISKTKIIY
jgi:hypothetical protein